MSFSDGSSQPGTIRRGIVHTGSEWSHVAPGNGTNSMIVYGGAKTTDSDVYRVGIYGWRKRCLYCFILLLSIVIVVNLALTIWILSVLDFNMEGMGGMKVLNNGIRVTGRTEFQRDVNFQSLKAPENDALFVDSAKRVILQSRTAKTSGNVSSRFILGGGEARAECDRFEVATADGTVFFANRSEVAMKVENLRILGEGGSAFDGSIQTPVVRSEQDGSLVLESTTHSLSASAAQNLNIETRAGDIHVEALDNIEIESKHGEIRLDAQNIYVSRVLQAISSDITGIRADDQYQLCTCRNGRLFLANPGTDCRASSRICGS